jgi:hypothetical protein
MEAGLPRRAILSGRGVETFRHASALICGGSHSVSGKFVRTGTTTCSISFTVGPRTARPREYNGIALFNGSRLMLAGNSLVITDDGSGLLNVPFYGKSRVFSFN